METALNYAQCYFHRALNQLHMSADDLFVVRIGDMDKEMVKCWASNAPSTGDKLGHCRQTPLGHFD